LITRSSLMSIYLQLTNVEKNSWGTNAGYDNGYKSLYRYLYREPNLTAKPKIHNALKTTVGNARYAQLISQFAGVTPVSNTGTTSNDDTSVSVNVSTDVNNLARLITEIKAAAVNEIAVCDDITTLEELKRILEVVSNITTNHINILDLYNSLNSMTA
jgi:hypothetical protein